MFARKGKSRYLTHHVERLGFSDAAAIEFNKEKRYRIFYDGTFEDWTGKNYYDGPIESYVGGTLIEISESIAKELLRAGGQITGNNAAKLLKRYPLGDSSDVVVSGNWEQHAKKLQDDWLRKVFG